MSSNTIKGREGEENACKYLQKNGFVVLERNYRAGKAEIDLIVKKDTVLVFVEVKYRTGDSFGLPEDAVSDRKIDLIREAAENYILDQDWKGELRFDIVSIRKGIDILHIEDAF